MQVPLDGVVAWGTASVSMQHISGESQHVPLEPGSTVPAGSLNADGLLVIRATATLDESTPARIARMAASAQVGVCIAVCLHMHACQCLASA